MANRKGFYIFLTSILCLVAVIFSVTFAYSYFVFDTRESEEKPKVLVDDIYENYNLTSEGTLQEDLYTVYFMAQPIVANSSNPINQTPRTNLSTARNNSGSDVYKTTYGSGGKYDGFFESPTKIESNDEELGNTSVTTSSATVKNEEIYYLKKAENVFQGLTTDLLDAVGRPLCYKADNGGWNGIIDSNYSNSTYDLTFVGWSNNKKVASTDGYASQADFHIVDTRTPLSVYDTEEDGSDADDNIIYLYAIYTSGKDYSKTGDYPDRQDRYDAVNVRMYDKGNTDASGKTDFWPTREVTSDGREYFAFKNLSITDEQINQNLSFGISAAPVNDNGWDNNWLNAGGGENDPKRYGVDWEISNAGHYNIYVFVFCDRDYYDGKGNRSADGWDNSVLVDDLAKEYNSWPNSNTLKNFLSDKNIIYSGTSGGLIDYDKERDGDPQYEFPWFYYFGPQKHQGGFYFYVERIYEFKMLGGNKETFDYDDTSLNYFFDQDGSNTTFEAHNVFFNNMGIEKTYTFDDGSTLTTTHSVFGVVHEKTFPKYPIELGGNATNYLKEAVEGKDYTLSEGSTHSADLDGKLFKMTFTGYYDFKIDVVYKNNGEIDKVTLDIDVRHSDMFIKITDKDLVDRTDDMFIIHKDFDTNYQRVNNDGTTTRLLFDSIGIETNNYISGDWQFNQYFEYSGGNWIKLSTPKVVTLNEIVNMLEDEGLNLTSHLTKNVIPRSTILDPNSPYLVSKSYLWYVS